MSLIRWQPWQEIETLSRQLDRLFDDFTPANRTAAPAAHTWTPAIELKATDAAFVLRAELPGIAAKDLDIQVTRAGVSITGEYRSETKNEDGKFFRSEFRYGSFRRVVPLPVAIQNDQVKADFTDGILTLTLPKVVSDRPKVVKVNLADAITEPKLEADSNHMPAETQTTHTDDVWAEKAA
ncbi:Hsp20/alpha crystallin family protein [Leptolyngbya sp. FACHB-321]|uniref:Hsp20/alpha crystallin family protein n=1 Tax=Leptolyngbya sp. FACHB-321 TaxID=2692807 RepID=UPI001683841A|nr:Hsp20/alpha crystallin family protein [Leptolyngbya sp. FACHB-321]MBD2038492.1 Hsp20/alpha crystallin family protein [Leptolyngbya sp. FACHB-321]